MAGPVLAAFAFSLSLCMAIVSTQRWHGRFSHDPAIGVQKFHTDPTPRVGGAALAAAYWLVWPLLPPDLVKIWGQIGVAATPALIAGLVEDVTKRVPSRMRLLATMGAGALFVVTTGYAMAVVDLPGIDWLLSFSLGALLFTAFAMGGIANAVNIIDGFNGLAAGSCLIMLAGFAFLAERAGDPLVFQLALLYAGLIAGFFVINFPFGKLFLGDGGAYFCGFLLASLGVLVVMRNPDVSAWAAMLVCGYPVIETLASMRRKSRRHGKGHSMGNPDRVHFHMLAYRRYGRRLVPGHLPRRLRNPATSVVTWALPLTTTAFVMLSWNSAVLSAAFFFLAAYIYGAIYGVMSLNRARVPRGLSRLF
jgi:UDP-N-acetylmuramyl pentapeptide phosphotransferase/UDP-N-acetylglucosamine-1-phosphate transferase